MRQFTRGSRFRHRLVTGALIVGMSLSGSLPAYAAFPEGKWKQSEDGTWQFVYEDGRTGSGWLQVASGWYYLQPESGKMMIGQQEIGGKLYHFETASEGVEGKMKTGWYQSPNASWYFFDNKIGTAGEGCALVGWHWIDGYCYYFEKEGENRGRLMTGTTTPDGFTVAQDGAWVDSGVKQYRPFAQNGYVTKERPSDGAPSSVRGGSSSSGGSSGGSDSKGGTNSENHGNANESQGEGSEGNTNENQGGGGEGNTNENQGGGSEGNTNENQGGGGEGNTDGGKDEENNNENPEPPSEDEGEFLRRSETRIMDLGYAQYAVLSFKKGSVSDYKIYLNGKRIYPSQVDLEGTIAKWEVSSLTSQTLQVEKDGKVQSLVLERSDR